VYFNTVRTFPQAIFVLSAALVLLSLVLLSLVRLPGDGVGDEETPAEGGDAALTREPTLVADGTVRKVSAAETE
jgi:hypothetical protein